MNNFNDKVSFIWSVADLLRGPYKPAQYMVDLLFDPDSDILTVPGIVAAGYPPYADETVWINDEQGSECVPQEVWDFHIGGYQVCQKWLKDRRGRTLSDRDKVHCAKIVVALQETMQLMEEIDAAIPGWPIT
jgi:hypothetical protein